MKKYKNKKKFKYKNMLVSFVDIVLWVDPCLPELSQAEVNRHPSLSACHKTEAQYVFPEQ